MISKAQRLDGKGEVEGLYIPSNPDMQDGIAVMKQTEMCRDTGYSDVYTETIPIKPETLKHSFDNGTSWWSEDEIKEKLQPKNSCEWKDHDEYYGVFDTSCGNSLELSGTSSYISWVRDSFKFCPYCGHEIKALETE